MVALTRRFGAVARHAANRAPGEAGGRRVLHHERATLKAAGQEDLARRVIRVPQEAGDGADHDIAGFTPQGRARLIEVKTTDGWERPPSISAPTNSPRGLVPLPALEPRAPAPAFELQPPLDRHAARTATRFRAGFS
mgnify:CR=1 FL=1